MSEERREILRMLSEGKLTIEEAEMLLDALGDTAERQKESTGQRDYQSKCRGPFFGDFDFKFGDFAKTFDHFGETFSRGFGEAFGDFFSKKGSSRV